MSLYLIASERKLYDKLPADLKKSWGGEVKEEMGTAWETDEQLSVRSELAAKHLSPKAAVALGKMIKKLQREGIDAITEKDFPKSAFPHILNLLGAVGLTAVIYETIADAASGDDLDTAETLSNFRHQMLMANALAFDL